MPISTLTSKGQITVPIEVRRSLDLNQGDKVDFVPIKGGGYKLVALRAEVQSLRGRFSGRVSKPISLEEMDAAIASGAARALRARP